MCVLLFPAVGEMRKAALWGSAPLKRVQFKIEDEVEDHQGNHRGVEEVLGVFAGVQGTGTIPARGELGTCCFNRGPEALLTGQLDTSTVRPAIEGVDAASSIRRHPARGLMGGRIDWIRIKSRLPSSSRCIENLTHADGVGLGQAH